MKTRIEDLTDIEWDDLSLEDLHTLSSIINAEIRARQGIFG